MRILIFFFFCLLLNCEDKQTSKQNNTTLVKDSTSVKIPTKENSKNEKDKLPGPGYYEPNK